MAKQPTHPIAEPDRPGDDRPDHELPDQTPDRPDRPGARPDHELPKEEKPQPKGRASAREVAAPVTGASGLLPSSAAIGDPSFMLRVVGYGFDASSVIVFAGNDEPTNHVSDTELTTGVDMSVWLGVDPAIPVLVRTTLPDGTVEETTALDFAFTEARAVPLPEAYPSQPIPAMDLITRV